MQKGIALTSEQQLSLRSSSTAGSTPGTPPLTRRATRRPGRGPGTRHSSAGRGWGFHLGGSRSATPRWYPGRSGCEGAGGLRLGSLTYIDVRPAIVEEAGIPEPTVSGRDRSKADGGGQASSTPSKMRTRRSAPPRSPSRPSGTGRSTRTAGGPPASSTEFRGTSAPPTISEVRARNKPTRSRTPLGSCAPCPNNFSQAKGPRREEPGELTHSKELFWDEAEKRNVLPLLAVLLGLLRERAAVLPTVTTHTMLAATSRTSLPGGRPPRLRRFLRDRGGAIGTR